MKHGVHGTEDKRCEEQCLDSLNGKVSREKVKEFKDDSIEGNERKTERENNDRSEEQFEHGLHEDVQGSKDDREHRKTLERFGDNGKSRNEPICRHESDTVADDRYDEPGKEFHGRISRSRLLPPISGGFGMPKSSKMVGATSART